MTNTRAPPIEHPMEGENPMDAILKAAREERATFHKKMDDLIASAEAEKRSLTDDESAKFEKLAKSIKSADKQIAGLETEAKRKAEAIKAAADVLPAGDGVVRRERLTYELQSEAHSYNSYVRDLAWAAIPGHANQHAAEERLAQHSKEVEIESRSNRDLQRMLHEIARTPESLTYRNNRELFEMRVNPNTTAGTGGEFVPPLWLVSSYVPFVRPDRVFANRCTNKPLPPGIDVINIPKITTSSLTAIQPAQGAAVASQDIATSTVSGSVNTISGQEDISLQLLEQSPIAMDGVVFDDLQRDYSQRLDLQVVQGTGSNGQHKGVLNVSGATSNTSITNSNYVTVGSTTFHDTSTANTQYRSILNGINQIETLRFAPPTAIWVHPRRVNSWLYSASDTQARLLFVQAPHGPFNAIGTDNSVRVEQGVCGELLGLPVVKDANMPTTMSGTAVTGGTADAIVVLKEDDVWLFEGTLRMRALPEILSGTLQIRYQVYAYSAFIPTRFPPSLSLLTGNTGLAAPGF